MIAGTPPPFDPADTFRAGLTLCRTLALAALAGDRSFRDNGGAVPPLPRQLSGGLSAQVLAGPVVVVPADRPRHAVLYRFASGAAAAA
jgi:hypothetical protein